MLAVQQTKCLHHLGVLAIRLHDPNADGDEAPECGKSDSLGGRRRGDNGADEYKKRDGKQKEHRRTS